MSSIRLFIEDKEYYGFNTDNISLIYNSLTSTFGFSGLDDYSPVPLKYPKVRIEHDNTVILTGTVINQSYEDDKDSKLVSVSGYSLSGILEDCTIPLSAMPMQLDNMSIKDVCQKLLPLYGLKFSYEDAVADRMTKKFEKINFDYDKTLKSIIVSLASERGVFVHPEYDGSIRFTDSDTWYRTPNLYEDHGVINMSLNVNGQAMHSHIHVLSNANEEGVEAGQYTLKNPYVTKERHLIVKQEAGDFDDLKSYARIILGSELSNIQLTVRCKTFENPGELISVLSPKLKINKQTLFFVERTDIEDTTTGITYTLTCVPYDVYTTNDVKNIFL